MESLYQNRFGQQFKSIFQLHCLLSANLYQSWSIPTNKNSITIQQSMRIYIKNLYSFNNHGFNSLENFTKAILRRQIVIEPHILFNHLNTEQKACLNTHFVSQIQKNSNHNFTTNNLIFVYHSLWLGCNYPPEEYHV